jgi:hypothetical protein
MQSSSECQLVVHHTFVELVPPQPHRVRAGTDTWLVPSKPGSADDDCSTVDENSVHESDGSHSEAQLSADELEQPACLIAYSWDRQKAKGLQWQDAEKRQASVCIYDAILEYVQAELTNYQVLHSERKYEFFIHCLADPEPEFDTKVSKIVKDFVATNLQTKGGKADRNIMGGIRCRGRLSDPNIIPMHDVWARNRFIPFQAPGARECSYGSLAAASSVKAEPTQHFEERCVPASSSMFPVQALPVQNTFIHFPAAHHARQRSYSSLI